MSLVPTGVVPGVTMVVVVPSAAIADVVGAVPPIHAVQMATPSAPEPCVSGYVEGSEPVAVLA